MEDITKNITEEDRQEILRIVGHISILESNHTATMLSLKISGTIRTDRSCAKGQDFDHGPLAMVIDRGATCEADNLVQGTYHGILHKFKEPFIKASRKKCKRDMEVI